MSIDKITSADAIANYTICTSGTRPGSPIEGSLIYETDTDLVLAYNGSAWRNVATLGAWTTWTPGVHKPVGTQPTYTTQTGKYMRTGMHIEGWGTIIISSAISTGSAIKVSLPVAMANVGSYPNVGQCRAFIGGVTSMCNLLGVTDDAYGALYAHGGTGVLASSLASGDQFYYQFSYEAS